MRHPIMSNQGISDYIKGRVEEGEMRSFLTTCFVKAGLKKSHADAVADQMVNAGLRGVDTHGAVLTERYVDAIKSGEINASPRIRPLRVSGALEVLDGD